ncbi:hypothetical protein [Streptomyces sp. NBC_00273]|uniref:hypothetical protein n=1 Tax=Streptomyces sp. NBC_00273 TaxID=2903644 RepID=UPI002E2A281F|nr:hypothetical protein [Streptomyces sp. NBC_00273]
MPLLQEDANRGPSIAIRRQITDGAIPAVRVGGNLKIHESDLPPLAMPVIPSRPDKQVQEQVTDDLNALVANLVASWPELPMERRVELGRLLATP